MSVRSAYKGGRKNIIYRTSTFSLKVSATPSLLPLLRGGNLGRGYSNELLFLAYLAKPYIPFQDLVVL
jgi:hypothetical protein